MKKLSILALVLVMAMAFSGAAFAAQAMYSVNGFTYYSATPTGDGTFNADGKTNYPYEIYLPNEEDPASYRIHSNYNKNTDACASCHATHTAVGPSLLQWYSVYETCMACHDGTVTTTYNVEEGTIGASSAVTYGGHFGNMTNDKYLSSHNVKGAVDITAAPGGSVVGEAVNVEGDATKAKTRWAVEFGCQSCHTPHGQGGNARILHPDANWAATDARSAAGYQVNKATGNVLYGANNVYILKGYPYKPVIKYNGTVLEGAYISNTSGVSQVVYPGLAALPDEVSVEGTAGLQVTMGITNYLAENEAVTHKTGLNSFCGACHTDYNTESQVAANGKDVIMGEQANRSGYGASTGKYAQAHRHAVGVAWNYGEAADTEYIGSDKLMKLEGTSTQYISCLTCHFAHGTSESMWYRWINKYPNVKADGWGASLTVKEIAGSSALKRLPNMATCEACHQKGDAAEGYLANTSYTYEGEGAETVDNAIFETVANAQYVDEVNSPNLCTASGCHASYNYDTASAKYTNHNAANVNNAAWKAEKGIPDGTDVVCQVCHGPASLHIKGPNDKNIINPGALTFNNSATTCAGSTCHDEEIGEWAQTRHNQYNAANCATCHEAHNGASEVELSAASTGALCATCHTDSTTTTFSVAMALQEATDSHTFGKAIAAYNDTNDTSTNKAWVGSSWIAQKSKLSQRSVYGLSGSHANLPTTYTTSTCWRGNDTDPSCHANPADNMYKDVVGTIHFSQTGQTEGLDNHEGKLDNKAQGMRNRY